LLAQVVLHFLEQSFFAEVPAALVGASFTDAFIAVPFLDAQQDAPSFLAAAEHSFFAEVPAALVGASFTDAFIAVPFFAVQVLEHSFLSAFAETVVAFASVDLAADFWH